MKENYRNFKSAMKKFIPYLLFSATTLHTVFSTSPIMAMGCGSHSDKVEAACEDGDKDCKEEISISVIN